MRTRSSACLAAAVLALYAGTASAAVIVSDNFDGYANQAAFEASWTPIGTVAPTSAVLSTTQAKSPTQSIELTGTAASNSYRNRKTFADTAISTATSKLIWSFDFYDVATNSPYRSYCNLQDTNAPGATNQLVSMGFNNNQSSTQSGGNYFMARILGYTVPTTADPDGGPTESVGGAGAYFKLNDFGVGLRSTGWHNLKVVITSDDRQSADYYFYVDDQLAEQVLNVGTNASFDRGYDNITLGSGLSNASVTSYVDNMTLELIPEPTSLGLLAGGAMTMLRRRR